MTGDGPQDDGARAARLSPERRELLRQLQRERDGEAPASCAQERFWFLERLEPGNPAHHVAGRLRIDGDVDGALLARAVALLVERHAVLRTTLAAPAGRPVQRTAAPTSPPLPEFDLRALPADQREAAAAAHREAVVLPPFDLAAGPLLRQSLLRWGDRASEYVWCVHHVAVDGPSMVVLAGELAQVYDALRGGRAPQLPAPVDYAAVARAQRRWLESAAATDLLAQWRRRLDGLMPLELPEGGAVAAADAAGASDRPRGARVVHPLDDGAAAALLAMAPRLGVTPFQLFLTGFAALLHRLTGSTDFAVGTPVQGRSPAQRLAVGPFLGGLCLRLSCPGDHRFSAFATAVRGECLWALERQALPFERLVEALAPERHPTRHPLFQVLVNYVDFDWPEATLGGQPVHYDELPAGTLLDLALYVRRRGSGLRLEFEYDAHRLHGDTVAAWLRALAALLVGAAADPECAVGDLPLLPATAAPALRAARSGPPLPSSPLRAATLHAATLHAVVSAAAARAPERPALRVDGAVIQAGELQGEVLHLAAVLHRAGVATGQRIGVAHRRDRHLVPLLLALSHLGAAWVPLAPTHGRERLRAQAAAARLAAVVADGSVPGWDGPLLRLADLRAAPAPSSAPAPVDDGDLPVYLLHTSGSTGAPKGVVVPQRALVAFLLAAASTLDLGAADGLLAITPLTFDIAALELFLPLVVGGTVHLAGDDLAGDPARLQQALADPRVTALQATPTTWRLLWRHGFAGRTTLKALCGGESLQSDLAAFLRTRCSTAWNLYGPTETTVWSLCWRIVDGPVRIGRPLPGTTVRVLDDRGRVLPIGVAGELAIGGAGVALGYFDDPERTGERFVADPLGPGRVYRTGDRVQLLNDGDLLFCGRLDEQLKVHGHRVEPGEVEVVLRRHPAVADAAVDLRGDGDARRLCAWLVPRTEDDGGGDRGEREALVAHWAAVWRDTYGSDRAPAAAPHFDLAGWRDSAHGQPLPEPAMRAWRDGIVDELLDLVPRAVLEIGCGTGLLAWPLLDRCERWVGVDGDRAVVDRLRGQLAAAKAGQASAYCARADDLDAVVPARAEFDVVVLNSVAQYFPDLTYLLAVLDAALLRLRPGGAVFLGDLRLLGLLPAVHASAAHAAVGAGDPEALRRQFRQRLARERELLLDLQLLRELCAVHPRQLRLRVACHRSGHDDELTRFRANAVLWADCGDAAEPAPRRVETPTVAALERELDAALPLVAIVPDVRTSPWVRLAAHLQRDDAAAPGAEFDFAGLAKPPARRGVDRATWCAVGAARGIAIVAAPGDEPGTLALHCGLPTRPCPPSPPAASPAAARPEWSAARFAARWSTLATSPLQQHRRAATIDAVRQQLQQLLPPAAIPTAFAWIAELPRSANGKLLRRALPAPDAPTGTAFVPPAAGDETAVAARFARLLGATRVSAHDDFFALGGHSLLATQLVAALAADLGVELPLRAVFAAPTVKALARAVAAARGAGGAPIPPLPASAPQPLLPGHERLWFLHRLDGKTSAFHLAGIVTIDGPVAVALLVTALRHVVARHQLLRSRVDAGAAPPRLLPAEPRVVVDAEGDAGSFAARAVARAQLPFDLGAEAPLRAYVCGEGDRAQVLLVLHHAAADGWSLGVLARDLATAVGAAAEGSEPDWPALACEPAAFAADQRRRLSAPAGRELVAAACARFDGVAPLELRGDLPRPAVQDLTGARWQRRLPGVDWERAQDLARELGATPFQLLATGVALWLGRVAGQRDFALGTVSAGRDGTALADLVGCFVQVVPLRISWSPEVSFRQCAVQARAELADVHARSAVPFAQLIAALALPRDLARPPLVQVTIEWFDGLPPPSPVLGHPVTVSEVPVPGSKFDLTVRFVASGEGPPVLQLEYATALYSAGLIEAFAAGMLALLRAALATPERAVASLPLCAADAVRELRRRGSGPPLAAPAPLLDRVFACAARFPTRTAVTWDGGASTFAALVADVRAFARGLLRRVGPGAVIGLDLRRGPHLLPAVLGVLAAGGCYLPLGDGDPPARRRRALTTANAALLLGDAPGGDDLGVARVTPAELLADGAREDDAPLPPGDGDAPAYVLFTSGSTGPPKGVSVSRRALDHYLAVAAARYCDGAGGGAPLATPLSFDLSVTALFAPLLVGEPVHLAPPGDGVEPWLRLRGRAPFAFAKVTPAHLRALAAAGAGPPAARTLVVGGEVLAAADVAAAAAAGARIVNEYGPTETTVGCVAFEVPADGPLPPSGDVPIGRPLPGVRLAVVAVDGGLLPPGAVGELAIGGAGVALGYLGDAAATAASFESDPEGPPGSKRYRSGDLARWTADGVLVFAGRIDHQVKVLGVRVEPGEVAAVLRAVPAVREAVVGPVPAPGGGVQLGAWITATGSPAAAQAAAATALARELPAAVRPRFVLAIDELPLTRHGKVDRQALPLPPSGGDGAAAVAPSPAAATLQRLLGELLRTEVGPDDDFFTLGGDSILALQLVARAAERHLHLPVRAVFEHRTARAMAAAAAPAPLPAEASHGDPLAPAELLPLQRRWVERVLAAPPPAEPGHDVQAVVATVAAAVSAPALAAALDAVVAAHPLLRARLQDVPLRLLPGLGPAPRLQTATLPADDGRALAQLGTDRNRAHDPRQGRVFAATLCTAGDERLLHLSIHHLVVDAVSWRTLFADLDAALRGCALPPPVPFAAFARHLPPADAEAWRPHRRMGQGWPLRVASAAPAVVRHDAPLPELRAVLGSLHLSAGELVVAAVARALHRAAGGTVRIDVERHGRDLFGDAVSAARAIGWFTAVHPLWLELPPQLAASAALRAAKVVLRGLPVARAAADEPAPLLCNFLGELEFAAAWSVQPTTRDAGVLRAPGNPPANAVELDVWIRDRRLWLLARTAAGVDAEPVRSLLPAVVAEVETLLLADPAAALDPSDFPLAAVDAQQLDDLGRAGPLADLFPLTPTQRGMLVHALQQPGSLAYREQLVHEFEGDVDEAALAMALGALQRRHTLLRAGIAWRDLERPLWLVRRHQDVPLPLRHRDAGDDPLAAARWLRRFAAADRRAGFDLGSAPLWRCTHVRLPQQRHALVFTYHHVLLDGWSMPLLLAEMVRGYAAAQRGGAAAGETRPAPPYRDFVAWLQHRDEGAARAFWRRELGSFAAPTPLGIDWPAPPDRPPAAHAETELTLPEELGGALAALGRSLGTTGSALLQAALALWLQRAGGSRDVLFGLTVSGRPAELGAAEERIGLFINTIPVRIAVPIDGSVRAFLQQVLAHHAELLPWHWTPLPLSQAQAAAPPGRPLFDVLLVFENYPLDQALLTPPPGLRALATWSNERTSYPLTLVAIPGDRWLLRALYAPDRFEPAAIARLLQQVAAILQQFAAAPDGALAHVCGDATVDGAGDLLVSPPHDPVPALASGGAGGRLIDGDVDREWAEVDRQAAAMARALAARGVGRGAVVAVCARRSAAQVAAALAVWRCGAALAPLDPDWPEAQVECAVALAQPALVLVDGAADAGQDRVALRHLLREAPEDAGAAPFEPGLDQDADGLAAVLFTSGSTGAPKAVELGRAGLAHYAAAAAAWFGLSSADVVLQFASPAFDTALEELLPTRLAGATLLLRRDDDLDPAALLRHAAARAVTVLDLPTAWFHALVAHLEQAGTRLPPSVRLVVLGGEAARAAGVGAFLRRHPGVRLCNTYGPTEATVVATWCDLVAADAAAGDPLPIGTPVPGVRASVRGADGTPVLPGARGELWLGGSGLARGYRGDDRQTAARFCTDPDGQRWYRTGDLVQRGGDGRLRHLGRVDRQVKIRGQRVEPEAVEAVLLAHPDIAAAAVVADADGGDGDLRLLALTVPRAGAAPTPTELRAFARARLPAAAVPAVVGLASALPLSSQNKVDAAAVRRAVQAAMSARTTGAGARTTADGLLAAVRAAFAAVLGVDVDDDADFFALGGDSLAAIRLLDAVRSRTGREPTLAQVFAGPSPAALAAQLRAAGAGVPAPPAGAADAIPAEDLEVPAGFAPAAPHGRGRRVLVTGAGGFLGGAVVRALLQCTDSHVIAVQRRAPTASPPDPRVEVVPGDLSLERFGLDADRWAALHRDLDAVYHVAANTNVWLSYAALRRDNVVATRRVIDLCGRAGAHLHHVSTIGVFDDPTLPADAVLDESFPLARLAAVAGGYPRSKWAAECNVAAAAARGLRATIYRPGRLAAGLDGRLPQRDLGLGLFELCVELGCSPDLDVAVDLMPVDWAAHALVGLSQRQDAAGRTFHLLPASPQRLAELWQLLDELGVPLRRLPWPAFLQLLRAHLLPQPAHPLGPVLAQWRAILPGTGPAAPTVRCERTHEALRGMALPPARIGAATLLAALDRLAPAR